MNNQVVNAGNGKKRMETGDHFKNGASPKRQTSRGDFLRTKLTAILAAMLVMVSFDGYAQKLTTGSINFLKGQEKLHVVLNFEDIALQGKSEKEMDLSNYSVGISFIDQ